MVWRSPRHLHPLFARGIIRGRRRARLQGCGRLGNGRRSGGGTLDRRHHVALGYAPVLAGAGNGRGIDAGFRRQPPHRRRNPRVVCRLRPGFWARTRLLFRRVDGRGRVGLLVRAPQRGGRGLAGSAFAFFDLPKQCADGDRLAVLGRDLAEHASGRRRHLDRHLVSLELHERLVDSDRITRFLEPLADGRLGHGFAQCGHADVSHGANIPCGHASRSKTTEGPTTDGRKSSIVCRPPCGLCYPSAASNSALSCLRCSGIWPTAVAAEAARPA